MKAGSGPWQSRQFPRATCCSQQWNGPSPSTDLAPARALARQGGCCFRGENRWGTSKEGRRKHLLMKLLLPALQAPRGSSRSADPSISALHLALAPFLPQALTFAAAKIIFACAAEQLEQAVLISPTDQSWKKRTSFRAPNASYLIKQVEHIQILEYPLKWATYPINWQDLKRWDKEDKVINRETEKKKVQHKMRGILSVSQHGRSDTAKRNGCSYMLSPTW